MQEQPVSPVRKQTAEYTMPQYLFWDWDLSLLAITGLILKRRLETPVLSEE
jgi:hypothetical protein